MHRIITLALIAGLVCSVPIAWGAEDEAVSFARDISPILKRRCAVCHITGQEPGLLSLVPAKAYASLVGVASQESPLQRVKLGEPDNSYLYRKLVGSHVEAGGEGAQMPFSAPPLPPEQLDLFRRWIEQGALDN